MNMFRIKFFLALETAADLCRIYT